MARAQETAAIVHARIRDRLDREVEAARACGGCGGEGGSVSVEALAPNPMLNEGRPAHVVPEGRGRGPAMQPRTVHRDHPRIEAAFRGLFYRAKPLKQASSGTGTGSGSRAEGKDAQQPKAVAAAAAEKQKVAAASDAGEGVTGPLLAPAVAGVPVAAHREATAEEQRHEYDVVVCHGNVIRYFAMRALQLPPEAWLRLSTFNCSLTYLVVRPGGSVSLRALGDVGHLDMAATTFSGHHGFEW